MYRRSDISRLSIILIAVILFAGCGNGNGVPDQTTDGNVNKIVLRFAHNWTNGDTKAPYFEPMLEKYARLREDSVEFIFEATSKMDHKHKIQVDVASGNTPDIFTYWAGSPFASLVQADALADMGEYLSMSKQIKAGHFDDEMFDSLIFNDKTYGIPYEVYKSFLLVNRELFRKAGIGKYPETIEELISMAPQFEKIGVIPAAFTSKNGDPSHTLYSSFLFQYAGEYEKSLDISNTFLFKNENTIKAAQAIEALRIGKVIPMDTIQTGGDEGAVTLYNSEKAAMVIAFPWMIQMIDEEIAEKSDIIAVPSLSDFTEYSSAFCVGAVSMGIAVNKGSLADELLKNELIDFIDYLVSDEMFRELAKSGMFPAKNVEIDPETVPALFLKVADFTKNQELKLNHAKLFPNDEVLNVYLDSLDKLFAGAINAHEFNDTVQGSLDDAKEKLGQEIIN